MAYNDVPLANQRIKDSQAPIRANFLSIQTAESVNHVPIEDPSGNQGKHTFIQMPNVQGADVATALGEIALYTKTGITGVPALFFRGESNAVVPSAGFTETANSWVRLPSGILLKWGFVAPALPNPCTVTYPVAANIPVFTAVYNVQITMGNTAISDNNWFASLVNNSLTTTTFQVWTTQRTSSTAAAVQLYYLAIGI